MQHLSSTLDIRLSLNMMSTLKRSMAIILLEKQVEGVKLLKLSPLVVKMMLSQIQKLILLRFPHQVVFRYLQMQQMIQLIYPMKGKHLLVL